MIEDYSVTNIFTEGLPQSIQDMAALRDFRQDRQAALCAKYSITDLIGQPEREVQNGTGKVRCGTENNTTGVAESKAKRRALIMFSLVIPGPVKTNALLDKVFETGLSLLQKHLTAASIPVLGYEEYRCPAGNTAFWCTDSVPETVKRLCTGLERTHPLGSLFDFDVFLAFKHKLSAVENGLPPRPCLLCTAPAKMCARSRKHSVAELQQIISERVSTYFNMITE